jgi:hypothetical protein
VRVLSWVFSRSLYARSKTPKPPAEEEWREKMCERLKKIWHRMMEQLCWERINDKRLAAGWIYIVLGIFTLFMASRLFMWPESLIRNMLTWIKSQHIIYWCVGWSFLGVGAYLINTRKPKPPQGEKKEAPLQDYPLHLIGYCGFIVLVVSILSFVIAIYHSGENYFNPATKLFSLSALVALVGGFLGRELIDVIKRWGGRFN